MSDTGDISRANDGSGEHSVRDLLIERIARELASPWETGVAGDGNLSIQAKDPNTWAADLLDSVFCDPEIREALLAGIEREVNGAIWSLHEITQANAPSEGVLPGATKALSDLFGPVKEAE